MPTTVVKTVGSTGGRDYSTWSAWEAACPANLVTNDEIWEGQGYNDSEFTASSTLVTIAGMTVDATRFVRMTAAAGQSCQDHASVRTNALRYNASNGVALRQTGGYGGATVVNSANYTQITRLQFSCADGTVASLTGTTPLLKDCIIRNTKGFGSAAWINTSGDVFNCVVEHRGGTGPHIRFSSVTDRAAHGCTTCTPTDVNSGSDGIGVNAFYSTGIIVKSCAFFGVATASSTTGGGSFASSGGWNATNLASGLPGSNSNQHSVSYSQTTPFTDADKDSLDLRAIASTTLAANGNLDSTNAPNDISGQARAAPPTIGAWELVTAAVGHPARRRLGVTPYGLSGVRIH